MILISDKDCVSQWVADHDAGDFPIGCFAAIGATDENDKIVAGVVYDHYTKRCVTATIAVEKKNLPRRLIRAIFKYPFEQLGVDKIIVYVNEANAASVCLASRLGFLLEGRIEGVYPDGDMLIMSVNKTNCVWLWR